MFTVDFTLIHYIVVYFCCLLLFPLDFAWSDVKIVTDLFLIIICLLHITHLSLSISLGHLVLGDSLVHTIKINIYNDSKILKFLWRPRRP